MAPRKIKPRESSLWIIGLLIILGFICVSIIIFYLSQNYCDKECRMQEFQKGRMSVSTPPPSTSLSQNPSQVPSQHPPPQTSSYERDLRVVKDPLYPPLNRTETANHIEIKNKVENRQLYVSTRSQSPQDEYRLIGYYVADTSSTKDSGNNSWKLFARKVDSNRSNFYMSPTDKNLDIKVPITDEIIAPGYRLRDIYDIPSTIKFKSPLLLADDEYKLIELPKTDLSTAQNYF